jgi:DNA-binding LacI/PurR family transcriptional regulator
MDDEATAARTRPNLAAVAALAGVSPSTASLAFSGSGPVSAATRERVLAAAAQLDYAGPDPRAQSLRRGRSGIIGVVIEDRLRDAFRDPMNIAMLDLLLTENGEGAASIRNAPVDAVVLIGCSTSLAAQVAIFRQRGIALVAIEAEPMDDVLAIDLDNRQGSHTLARHLSDLGHSRVAMVTLPLGAARTRGVLTEAAIMASTGYTALERIRGVREVFVDAPGMMAAVSSIEEGLTAGLALLSDPSTRPTAVIAQSDLLAVGVIRAAEQLGLAVPADLSIVGFDGVKLDGLASYDLATMVQPAVEKGRAAGRGVIALLAGEHPQPMAFTSRFHLGTTTAPPAMRDGY